MLDARYWMLDLFIEHRVSSIEHLFATGKNVLQQDRMPRMQFACQQSKGRNHCKIDIVSHGDKLRAALRIQFGNCGFITRIDFHNARVLIDNLRFVIAHLLDLVGDLVEVCLSDDYSKQLCATEFDSLAGITNSFYSQRVARATLIRIRIVRKLNVGCLLVIYWS